SVCEKPLFDSGRPPEVTDKVALKRFNIPVSFWRLRNCYIKFTDYYVQSPERGDHGRRYSINVQRLWARFHIHRCGSGVLSGTRLFDPQALQALPYGKKERSRWGRLRLSAGSIPWHSSDLLRLRTANHCSI